MTEKKNGSSYISYMYDKNGGCVCVAKAGEGFEKSWGPVEEHCVISPILLGRKWYSEESNVTLHLLIKCYQAISRS